MSGFAGTFDAATPPSSEDAAIKPAYAMVEIFGHRQHYAEIRDVEIAGGKLLEVRDVDTQKIHMYGSGAIFSLTVLTEVEITAHIADVTRRREAEAKWQQEREDRALARLATPVVRTDDNDEAVENELPF